MYTREKGFAHVTIAIIIGVLLIGGAGYFGTRNFPRPSSPQVSPSAVAPASTDVSAWKTYRNEKYGFEFKYPETWTTSTTDPQATNLSLAFGDYPTLVGFSPGLPVTRHTKAEEDRCERYSFTEGTFGTARMVRIEERGCPWEETSYFWDKIIVSIETNQGVVWIQSGNLANEMVQKYSDEIKKVFESVAPASTDVSVWKTYRNEKYGFEFKYPADHTPYSHLVGEKIVPADSGSDVVSIASNESRLFCCETSQLTIHAVNNFSWQGQGAPQEWKPSTFLGQNAEEVIGAGNLGSMYRQVRFKAGDQHFIISQSAKDELLEKILSTFTFIE